MRTDTGIAGAMLPCRAGRRSPPARAAVFLAAALLVAVVSGADFFGRTPPPAARAASSLDILDRDRDRARPAPRSLPRGSGAQESRREGEDAQEALFTLRSLSVSGSTVFAESELLAPYGHLPGTRVSFAVLKGVAADLTRKYREAGYLLSRVILPAQEADEAGARIRLTAVEGFISSIEYAGDERILEGFKAAFAPAAQRLVGKKPLKHDEFERCLLLARDLPGIRVTSRFEAASGFAGPRAGGTGAGDAATSPGAPVLEPPGAAPAAGATVLVLDVQGDLLEGSISWGTIGAESAGPGILSLNGGVNSLPLIGAATRLGYAQADNAREYQSLSLSQSWRSAGGLALTAAYAAARSLRADTDFARFFDYESESRTFTLGASYPLLRGRDLNLVLGIGYEQRDSDAFLLEERFTRDRLRALTAYADLDFADSLGGVTQVTATFRHGLDAFGASDRDPEASNPLAPAGCRILDLYASREQPLPYNFSLFAAAEAQVTGDSLTSYNRFSLGGARFGRGYEPGAIEGDNAFAVSLEPRWTWPLTEKTAIQPFAFIDWGTVWTAKSSAGAPDAQSASSFGGGVRFWGHAGREELPDFSLSAFVGLPLRRSGERSGNDRSPRFVVRGGLNF
jgi:hemolysin activation/secretion protein